MFSKKSRYANVRDGVLIDEKGRTVNYKRTRIIPPAAANRGHIITEGERLDHIAHFYFKDARRFWRICDANEVMYPDDMAADIGRKIKIPPAQD
jgi:hypothetical protein